MFGRFGPNFAIARTGLDLIDVELADQLAGLDWRLGRLGPGVGWVLPQSLA